MDEKRLVGDIYSLVFEIETLYQSIEPNMSQINRKTGKYDETCVHRWFVRVRL